MNKNMAYYLDQVKQAIKPAVASLNLQTEINVTFDSNIKNCGSTLCYIDTEGSVPNILLNPDLINDKANSLFKQFKGKDAPNKGFDKLLIDTITLTCIQFILLHEYKHVWQFYNSMSNEDVENVSLAECQLKEEAMTKFENEADDFAKDNSRIDFIPLPVIMGDVSKSVIKSLHHFH